MFQHLKAHSLETSLGPVRHLHAPLLHRYCTCSKSQPFLGWHSSARFLASRRTLPHVSLLMPLISLLMARFNSGQVLRITIHPSNTYLSTSSQPQGHRLVCYERQWHHRDILVQELQLHDGDRDNRALHKHLKQVRRGARSNRWR